MITDVKYKKISSILKLWDLGLNTHHTVITDNSEEAKATVRQFKQFTIRTDTTKDTGEGWGNKMQLPFMACLTPTTNFGSADRTIDLFINNGYALIIADGIKYDPIQSYNAVAKFESNGDFVLEFSTHKVPLRHMYSKDGVAIIAGNVAAEDLRLLEYYNYVQYDRRSLLRDMQDLYAKEIFDQWIELTRYPIRVGKLNDYFVFWQLRDK